MVRLTKTLEAPDGKSFKLIFEDDAGAVAEAFTGRDGESQVVCFSVSSGCPIGCKFCGTGRRFIRHLSWFEMFTQINAAIQQFDGKPASLRLMSMSMGEPMLNFAETLTAVNVVRESHENAELCVSTVGVRDWPVLGQMLNLASRHPWFGLQFSLHHHDEMKRRELLGGLSRLMSIAELVHYGRLWTEVAGRPVYWNYICHGDETPEDALAVAELVAGMHLTCSALFNTQEAKAANPAPAHRFAEMVRSLAPCDVSVCDCVGQDTIGGGCGQLLYVQEKLAQASGV